MGIFHLKTSLWIVLIALCTASFAHASEAAETDENLNSDSLNFSESTVEAEISPWLSPVSENFLEPDVFTFDGDICGVEESFQKALRDRFDDTCENIDSATISGFVGSLLLTNKGINTLNTTVLQAFTGATNVFFSNNNIAEVPAGAFANLVNIKDIRLDGNEISSIGANAFANLTKLETLYMHTNSISSIEAGLFTDLPALKEFDMHTNSISSIGANGFANLPKLETFFLQDNEISSIEAGAFTNTPKLKLLNLRDNNLISLPLNLFANHGAPEKLTDLRLSGNPFTTEGNSAYLENGWEITNVTWQSDASDLGYQLKIGHALAGNLNIAISVTNGTVDGGATQVTIAKGSTTSGSITVVPDSNNQAFSLTSELAEFDDWDGHIGPATRQLDSTYCGADETFTAAIIDAIDGVAHCSDITKATLAGLTDDLELNGTSITTINPLVTQALTGLTGELRLNSNNLKAIPAASFANLTSLKELFLFENEITTIGADAFANMSSVFRITLRDNKLTTVSAGLYSNHPKLDRLHLYNNEITSIETGAFDNLPEFRQLTLHNNSIESLDNDPFNGLPPMMEEIDLSDNNIASLPLNFLINITNTTALTTFNLTGNPVAAGDGWEITNASWVSDGSKFGYQLHIGHALPSELVVNIYGGERYS